MTTWTRRALIGSAAVLSATVLLRAQGAAPPAPAQATAQTVDYTKDIQPIFEKYCADCHGREGAGAAAAALAGVGEEGRPVWPGRRGRQQPRQRAHAPRAGRERRRPHAARRRSAAGGDIAKLRAWIDQGAPMPAVAAAASDTVEQHWAYVKPKRPDLPAVTRKEWVRNPIDAFVLARLEHEELTPSAEAAKTTLLRRVSLDLIGLPPTPAEVDAFVADRSPDAYEQGWSIGCSRRRTTASAGPALARPGALRRHQRLREGQPPRRSGSTATG